LTLFSCLSDGECTSPMYPAKRVIGTRPAPEPTPDLTLDAVLFLGIVLLAAILLMWYLPPAPFPFH
jgi:hypothetical protein